MGDLGKTDRAEAVIPVGADIGGAETYPIQVDLVDGVRRLQTTGLVQIEELFGQDNQADVWFYLGSQYDIGPISVGDTVRIQIAAGPSAILFPAIDLTYTVTVGDVAAPNPEVAVASGIVTMLNSNATFKAKWSAKRITDNSTVWIGSKEVGEWSERPNPNDFIVTSTGTIVVLRAYDKIIRRGKSTSLTKDPNDPRLGVLGITGTVAQTAGGIGQLYFRNLEQDPYGSGLISMNVDGSVTPVDFFVRPIADKDIYITELRWYAVSSAVKFGQFLNIASPLANGILMTIRSDDTLSPEPVYKTTEDMKNKFAIGGTWSLEAQPSSTSTLAVFHLDSPIPIRHIGAFTTDDYVRLRVRDNITSVAYMEMLAFGFVKDI